MRWKLPAHRQAEYHSSAYSSDVAGQVAPDPLEETLVRCVFPLARGLSPEPRMFLLDRQRLLESGVLDSKGSTQGLGGRELAFRLLDHFLGRCELRSVESFQVSEVSL